MQIDVILIRHIFFRCCYCCCLFAFQFPFRYKICCFFAIALLLLCVVTYFICITYIGYRFPINNQSKLNIKYIKHDTLCFALQAINKQFFLDFRYVSFLARDKGARAADSERIQNFDLIRTTIIDHVNCISNNSIFFSLCVYVCLRRCMSMCKKMFAY